MRSDSVSLQDGSLGRYSARMTAIGSTRTARRAGSKLPASVMSRPTAAPAENIAMMEMDRRRKNIPPPDPESWNKQMQAARLFDELISNAWRKVGPGP
jgi:hypothetical protein